MPGGKVGGRPAPTPVVGRSRVGVVVDHRRGGVGRFEPGHRAGHDHGRGGEEEHGCRPQSGAQDPPGGRTGSQGPPRRQRHDPRPDQDPGAPQAQKREGVQRVRQGGEGDVEERPQQVGVTRRLAGHRVDERRERPQRREQHERGERERNWVAGDELQP